MTWSMAHAACSVLRSSRRRSAVSRSGQVYAAVTWLTGLLMVSGRRRGAPASPELRHGRGQGDRVERVWDGHVRERPGRQPAVLRAAEQHQDGRALEDLALE